MIAGIFNLGFLSLARSEDVDGLLDWWSDRLERDCRVDPIWGYFVDQRWFDLVPGFLSDFAIVRDPEYNAAYWNLHDRRLEHHADRYLVDGRPLAFFHFSGFDPEHPLVLSRHQDRISVTDHPALERLLAEYAAEVMGHGHAAARSWPYTYAALGDGTRPSELLRKLYDDYERQHDGVVASPFTLEGTRLFDTWLREPVPGAPGGVNRVLARVYAERPDLRAAFPDAGGSDRAALLTWAEGSGARDEPALERVATNNNGAAQAAAVPSLPRSQTARAAVATERRSALIRPGPWGVNLVADFGANDEHSSVARALVDILDINQVPVLPIASHPSASDRLACAYMSTTAEYTSATAADAAFPVNLICLPADALPTFANSSGEEFFAGRYSVGVALWETAEPAASDHTLFSLLEEVWAPSRFVADALMDIATIPVNTIRIPVQPRSHAARPGYELRLPAAEFRFLYTLESGRASALANAVSSIAAFREAFPSAADGASLLIAGASKDTATRDALRDAIGDRLDVVVLDGKSSASQRLEITEAADCVISLHGAEAFGLALAKAMSLGKPVIATGYSGNLDYMTHENSYLVDHRLVRVPHAEGRGPAQVWAEPNIEHAARLMRELFEDREGASARGAVGAADIRRTHSPQSAAAIIDRRLESIRATGRVRHAYDPARSRPAALGKLLLRIQQGPLPDLIGGRGGRARLLARRALLRAIGPYADHQRRIDTDLVAGIDHLSAELADLRRDAGVELARRMADLRRLERELGSRR